MELSATPKEINEVVSNFCHEVVSDSTPCFVVVKEDEWATVNECFPNVIRKVQNDGGEVVYGWQVWLWESVFIEAEYHAIWKSPTGDLIDITPKTCRTDEILFIPDPKRVYEGKDVDNIRKKLCRNNLVDDFIRLAECRFQLFSSGSKGESRQVSVPEDEVKALLELQMMVLTMLRDNKTPNAQCLCGSGSKFKHCHKKQIEQAAKYYGVVV